MKYDYKLKNVLGKRYGTNIFDLTKSKNFIQLWEYLLERISNEQLSIDDISYNVKIPDDRVKKVINDREYVHDISLILDFMKIRFKFWDLQFQNYKIYEDDNEIIIKRNIKPVVRLIYDKNKKTFSKLRGSHRHTNPKISKAKQIVLEKILKEIATQFIQNTKDDV